jgi:broad specificity phosphatase PhoE
MPRNFRGFLLFSLKQCETSACMDLVMRNVPASPDQIRQAAESPTVLLLSLGVAAEAGDLQRCAQLARALQEKHGIEVKIPLVRGARRTRTEISHV